MSSGDSAEMETNNQTFTLSLEDIDVNLLPNYFKKIKGNVMPLWSTSNLQSRSGIYYEFQVLAERDDEDLEENSNMTPCHICNINVPVTFIKEHNNSTKHAICTALADHALERIKRQLSEKFELATKKNNSTYYCDACGLAVKIKNKEEHETTKEHHNALAYDKLLNGLLMIYVDKDKVDEFRIGFNTTDGSGDSQNDNRDSDEKNNSADELKFAELRKYIDQVCSIIKPQHSIKAIEKDFIGIKTVIGDRIKVPVDSFHGFYTEGNKVQCRLCEVEVDDERAHIYEEKHVEKIMAPLKDKHCIRQLDNIIHCILCNKNIGNTHLSSMEHNLNLKNALICSDDAFSNEDDSNNDNADNYCNLCDKILPIGGRPESTVHRNSAEHRLAVWLTKSKWHCHMYPTSDQKILNCKICSVPVPNDVKDINEHLETEEHNTIYKHFLESNRIQKINKYKSFCQLCSTFVLMIDETSHSRSANHVKNFEKFQQDNICKSSAKIDLLETEHEYVLNTDGILNFDLDENCNVSSDESQIVSEILSKELETPNLMNLKVTEGNLILILTNTVEDLNDMKESLKSQINAQSNVIPSADLTQVYFLMEKTKTPGLLMCKVCQATVPNTVHEVNCHNKSRIHHQNFIKCINKGMDLLKDSDGDEKKEELKKKQKTKNKKEDSRNESENSKIDTISDISVASCSNSQTNLQSCFHSEIILPSCSNSKANLQSCSNPETILPSCSNSKANLQSCSNSETILPSCSNSKTNIQSFSYSKAKSQCSDSETNLQSCSNSGTILQPCSSSKANQQSCFNSETNLQSCSNSETCLPLCLNSETAETSLQSSQTEVGANSNEKSEAISMIKNEKAEFILCEVCFISIPNNDRCIKIHTDGAAHKQNSQNSIQIDASLELINHNYLLTKTNNPKEFMCHACNAKVLSISEHFRGAHHQMNYKAMLQKNKLTKVDDTSFFCGYCNVNVVFSHLLDHVRTGFHSLFVKSDVTLQASLKSDPNPQTSSESVLVSAPYKYCKTCEVKVWIYYGNDLEIHEKEKMHLDNLKKQIAKQNKSAMITQLNQPVQKTFHFCNVCKVKVPNHTYDIGIHENGKPHLDKVKSTKAKLENSSTGLSNEALKQNYVMEVIETGVLHCKVCKVRVPNSTSCVNIHTNGAPHKDAFNNLLKANGMTKIGSRFHCEYCSDFVMPSTVLKHIEDVKHMLKMCLASSGFLGPDVATDSASSSQSGQSLPSRRIRTRGRKGNSNNAN